MDDGSEIKKLLKRNLQINEENNRLLRKIYGSIQWGRFFRILYWVVIIGVAVGAFYFLQPLIESLGDVIKSLSSDVETLQTVGEQISDIGSIFDGGGGGGQ